MNHKSQFTSESVTEGHPDKICDQVSDSFLDEVLRQDKNGKVAVETLASTGLIMVAGEVTTTSYVDVQDLVRNTLKDIGYVDSSYGLDYRDCCVLTAIHEQSPQIALGVNSSKKEKQGAGDQGLMFGFATNQTPALMPLPIYMAHKLTFELSKQRKSGDLEWSLPDGKSQVTVEYEDNVPKRISGVVMAAQHLPQTSLTKVREEVTEQIIKPICDDFLDSKTKIFVNSTGEFSIGGPKADTGVTGRKIISDTYGGYGRHGGGAFSGKDPSKVDRSGAYAARYIAKNIVASGIADTCEVQLAYAIGVSNPVSVAVNTFNTSYYDDFELAKMVENVFPITPYQIIKELNLLRPIYRKTTNYGHFGRQEEEFSWEKTNKVRSILNEL